MRLSQDDAHGSVVGISGRDYDEASVARHPLMHHESGSTDQSSHDSGNLRPRDDLDEEGGLEHERLLDPESFDEFELQERSYSIDGAPFKPQKDQQDSPYPEVRAAVRNYDEDVPCNTFRAWTIGLSLVVVGASINTLLSLRQPSISIGPLIAQIVAWPMGHGWAAVIPGKRFTTFGIRWSLNPGPFNIKEHSVICVMANVSFAVAYSTDIILAQLVYYKQDFGMVFQLLLTICTQSLGYGIAGLLRKFLVYPASMIWPANLVSASLMTAMYEVKDERNASILGGNMSRYRWFTLVSGLSFLYYFIPGFFAKFLSVFAFFTWMAPQNVVINQIFGGYSGLSLLPITFDWTQISGFVGSPLIPPWYAIANTLICVIVFYVTLSPILHYTGAWYAPFLPISDAGTFDNTGSPYNTSRVLNSDFTLNEEAYKNYSPLFISTTFAVSYGLSFASISAVLVYTWLHSRKTIWRQYMNSTSEKPDIHMKMMAKYREAPTMWYMSLFVVMLGLGFYTVLGYPTNLTWWSFLLALFISFAFALPIGIIEAVTNTQIGLNVLTEFIYGYIQPGRPLALMLFKTFGYITMSQALSFVSDLKFGHYMKIPPRTMFMSQVVATTVSCFVQIAMLNFALTTIDDICDPHQKDHFSCPGGRVFFAASVIWGLIGPDRMFSPGRIYAGLFIFFVIGALLPVAIYMYAKRRPNSVAKYLMAPIIFGGAGSIPPATPLNYFSWGIVGFIFQYWIKNRYSAWWNRLNFLTSCGLDVGLVLGTLVVFFAFTLNDIGAPRWWGNSIVETTLDFQGTAVRAHVTEGKTFGPVSW